MNSSQWLIRSANNDSGRTTMVNCAVEAISTPLKPRLLLDLVYYWIPFIVRRGKMRIEKKLARRRVLLISLLLQYCA